MIPALELKSSLSHFTGTTRYIRDPFTGLMHTDGIEHLAERAGAQWLISDIGAVFRHHPGIKGIAFQLWTLTVDEDNTADPDLPGRLRHTCTLRAEIRVHGFPGRDLEDVSYQWCADGPFGVLRDSHDQQARTLGVPEKTINHFWDGEKSDLVAAPDEDKNHFLVQEKGGPDRDTMTPIKSPARVSTLSTPGIIFFGKGWPTPKAHATGPPGGPVSGSPSSRPDPLPWNCPVEMP